MFIGRAQQNLFAPAERDVCAWPKTIVEHFAPGGARQFWKLEAINISLLAE